MYPSSNGGSPPVPTPGPADQTTTDTVTVTATASDAGGITKAQLYVDWVLVQTISGVGPFTFANVALTPGPHVIAVYGTATSTVQTCNAITVTAPPAVLTLSISGSGTVADNQANVCVGPGTCTFSYSATTAIILTPPGGIFTPYRV